MNQSGITDQIEMLRVQLETALTMPLLLVVSSARDNDGKNVVAAGLARSMDAAGYSTLLVLADETREIEGALEPKSLNEVAQFGIAPYLVRGLRSNLRTMLIPSKKIRHTVSREGVARLGATFRETFQVTIVEAPAILTSSFALLTAVNADGLLLAVQEGRRVCTEDRQLAKTLAREQAPFLGVVTVAQSAMRTEQPSFTEPVIRTTARTVTADLEPSREGQVV